MHRFRNCFLPIQKWVAVVSLFSTILTSVKGAPWKLEGVVIPEGEGTITPEGQYPEGANVNVSIEANPGWFIRYLGVEHKVSDRSDGLDFAALSVVLVNQIGTGYLTNISGMTTMKSDTTVTATFWPLRGTFLSPLHDITTASDFTLAAEVEGIWPMTFEWRKDGELLPGQSGIIDRNETALKLPFVNVDPTISGTYTLTLSNAAGSASSSSRVDVRPILCVEPGGTPILTNHLSFTNSFTIELDTIYQNGHIFFTLDGSEPTFASPEYSAPITLNDSADLRAIACSSDFTTSAVLAPIHFEKAATVFLYYNVSGGGTIEGKEQLQVDVVEKGSLIPLRAIPSEGSYFVYWETPDLDDHPEITIRADHDTDIRATFASPIALPVGGQGTVEIQPNSPAYAKGTFVLLYPRPALGFYFVRWLAPFGGPGDAPNVTVPYSLSTYDPAPTALFAPLPAGQISLTVIFKGRPGLVTGVTTNVYPTGSTVTFEANTSPEVKFLRWSGDVDSTNRTLTLNLTTSKIIYAELDNPPKLTFDLQHQQITATNSYGYGSVIDLFSSPNLKDWNLEFSKTNFIGLVFEPWATTNAAGFFKAVQRGQ